MRVSANLGFLFQDVPLLERYSKAAKAGFRWVEVPLPYSETADSLRKVADQHGLKHSLINAPAGDWAAGQRGLAAFVKKEEFRPTIVKAIEYCRVLNCPRLHVMAGRGMDHKGEVEKQYFENISLACELCQEHKIQVFVEPICSAAIDGYFLNSYEQVEQLIQRGLKVALLLDYFHAQQICGSLTRTTKRLGSLVQYIQVAQVPSRNEPSSKGEIDFAYLFQMLRESGLEDCFVGCEYVQSDRDDFSWVRQYSLQFDL